jgi:hypothetical protein
LGKAEDMAVDCMPCLVVILSCLVSANP